MTPPQRRATLLAAALIAASAALGLAPAPAAAHPGPHDNDEASESRLARLSSRWNRGFGFLDGQPTLGIQVGLGSLSLNEDSMDVDGAAHLGGGNLGFRYDIAEWGGLDIRLGVYSRESEGGLVKESRSTASTSWLWYFTRTAHARAYVLGGFGTVFTGGTVDDKPYTYIESGLVLGLGREWLWGDHMVVGVDARGMILASDGARYNALDDDTGPLQWVNPPINREALMLDLRAGYRW